MSAELDAETLAIYRERVARFDSFTALEMQLGIASARRAALKEAADAVRDNWNELYVTNAAMPGVMSFNMEESERLARRIERLEGGQ